MDSSHNVQDFWQNDALLVHDAATTGDPTRILLIEADPRRAHLTADMLRSEWDGRLVVVHADRLGDGVQELIDHGADCALVGIDGADDSSAVIAQLRAAGPRTAIVGVTDPVADEQSLAMLRAGAQDVLRRRELNPSQLRRVLRHSAERKRCEVELAERALHDALTGLPNRVLFLDRLGVALDRSRRTGTAIAVLFLDVDNFKEINDTLGHGAGDTVLCGLAHRLRGMLRPMDTLARFGGDEFTLLFEDLASEREVVLIAERISRAAGLPIPFEDGEASVTVSIGVASVSDPSTPPEAVIREADAAMYRAKELGRARYELFDEPSRDRALERLGMESALLSAVERSELRVHYQPRVSLNGTHSVVGFEALVRWEHPDRGLIGPAEFLPLAEETGTVLRIGEYVLREALRALVGWRERWPEMSVSVNLSPRQLADGGLVSMVASQIHASGVDPRALCLEVSEQAVSRDPEAASRVLQGVKSLGVEVALDDYGVGSASLSQLRGLPVDGLKIHPSFVEGLDRGEDPAPVLGAIVDLGHAFGLGVTGEGVETDAQLDRLRALGCDEAQGYLLGRPVPGEQAEALLVGTPA